MRHVPGLIVRFVVTLALALRLLPAPAAALAVLSDPLASFPICHADDGTTTDGPPATAPTGGAHHCILCPVCLPVAAPASPDTRPPELPLPRIRTARLSPTPPATGPPPARARTAQPRGPPA